MAVAVPVLGSEEMINIIIKPPFKGLYVGMRLHAKCELDGVHSLDPTEWEIPDVVSQEIYNRTLIRNI